MLRVTHHRSLLTLMLGLILLAGPFHHVYAENPMDAVVIMDSSGSMKNRSQRITQTGRQAVHHPDG